MKGFSIGHLGKLSNIPLFFLFFLSFSNLKNLNFHLSPQKQAIGPSFNPAMKILFA